MHEGALALGIDTTALRRYLGKAILEIRTPRIGGRLMERDGSVDLVLCHDVVGRVGADEAHALLAEIARVLAEGGEARVFGFGEAAGEQFLSFVFSGTRAGELEMETKPVDTADGFGVLLVMKKVAQR